MSQRSRALHLTPRLLTITASCGIALVALVLVLVSALRSTPASTAGAKTAFQVNIGFDGRYKNGTWIPVHVTLSNTGTDFTGTLSIDPSSTLSPLGSASTLYQSNITLPTGAQKQITLYIPFDSGMPGEYQSLDIQLLDTHGRVIQTQSALLHALGAEDVFVGLLSDQPGDFGTLNSVDLPNRNATIVTAALNASNFPTSAAALDNFDMLVLDNFTTSSLNSDQLGALQAWIERGGALVEVGGLSWLRSLESLPATLVPVNITATSVLSGGVSLLPLTGPPARTDKMPDTLSAPIPISNAATAASSGSTTLLSSGATPLLVQRQQGHGLLYYLAFDPTLEPLAGWNGTRLLWQNLLLRTLGDQLLPPNRGAPVLPASGTANGTLTPDIPLVSISMQNVLRAMLPHTLPLPWPLIGLLIGYLLVLGPLRALIVQRLGRRWSWHIVLSTFVIFSSIAYGLALHEKNTAIVSNSISILQFNQDGAPTHITTYAGIFLPDQGTFRVTIPDTDLTHILPQEAATGTLLPQKAAISASQDGSQIDLNGENIWTMHTIISEQDHQLSGTIEPHLILDHNTLSGTLTNRLSYSLTDTYILTNEGYIHIGPLQSGQARTVRSAFRLLGDSNATLADRIAADNSLSTPYDLSLEPQNAGSLQQQHIAMLTALSGELSSFTCGLNICSLKNSALPQQKPFADPVLLSTPGYDPLLSGETSATLIGWASQGADASNMIAVNGAPTSGTHQVFVQVPLDIKATDTLDVPPDSLSAQLVAVKGTNVQTQPGLYLMNTGSVTFDLALPQTFNVQQHALIASLLPYPPDGIYQLGGGGIRTIADEQLLHLSLYNWQTGAWNTAPLHLYAFMVNQQAYVGPGQRILFKLENQNASLGTFIFGTPVVHL